MERETGWRGGRRQEMGLERAAGRTPDSEQKRIRRVRGKTCAQGCAGGAGWGADVQRRQVPSSASRAPWLERLVWEFISGKVPDLPSFRGMMSLGEFLKELDFSLQYYFPPYLTFSTYTVCTLNLHDKFAVNLSHIWKELLSAGGGAGVGKQLVD